MATGWRRVDWGRGAFDTAGRAYADAVAGPIRLPRHLVLVTLRGGARRLAVRTEDEHRYHGRDWAGAVSVHPAHQLREIEMADVRAEWATISLDPELLDGCAESSGRGAVELVARTNARDQFLAGAAAELQRSLALDGALDLSYCDAVAHAVAHHLVHRYSRRPGTESPGRWLLPAGRMRRLADYVDAHLDQPIRMHELAAVVGVSEGHLHRAFRATTGKTPLRFITERRVHHASRLLRGAEPGSVAEVAARVGFTSAGHFARVFRRHTGMLPSELRRGQVPEAVHDNIRSTWTPPSGES